jgi:hypothetical protein
MLVRITNSCRMHCVHCMTDSAPDGAHMTGETFAATLDLVHRIGIPLVMLSGGEPADHPRIVEFLRTAAGAGTHTSVLSNGMFLTEDASKRDAILEYADVVQVTNDKRYYPRFVPDFWHPKVKFERNLRSLAPFGRAKTANMRTTQRTPSCFNLRSLTRGYGIQGALLWLASQGRMCTPSVNVDGTIAAGEAPSCASVGHVSDSLETLTRNVSSLRCSRCGLVNNLDAQQRAAIGE